MSRTKGEKGKRINTKGPKGLRALTIELEMMLLIEKERDRSKTPKGGGRK